jgi:hypothetical protein
MWREEMKDTNHDRGNQYTGGKDNNIMVAKPEQGTSRAYTLSRLQREAQGRQAISSALPIKTALAGSSATSQICEWGFTWIFPTVKT